MNDYNYILEIVRDKYYQNNRYRKYRLWENRNLHTLFETNSKVEFKMRLNLILGDYKFKWYGNKFITKDIYSYSVTIV